MIIWWLRLCWSSASLLRHRGHLLNFEIEKGTVWEDEFLSKQCLSAIKITDHFHGRLSTLIFYHIPMYGVWHYFSQFNSMLFPKNLSNSEDCTSQARRPISGSNFGHTHYNTFPCTVCDLFFPTFVTGFSQKIPEKTVEFCEPIFRSNVRFQSPILDDRIISH